MVVGQGAPSWNSKMPWFGLQINDASEPLFSGRQLAANDVHEVGFLCELC